MGATFTAHYRSDCCECGEEIKPGDTAGYIADDVCCNDCVQTDRGFDGLL